MTQVIKNCVFFGSIISNGPMNTTLALQMLIWSAGAYNYYPVGPQNPNSDTEFVLERYGRYSWVYILTPILAGLVAGFIARNHNSETKTKFSQAFEKLVEKKND